MKVTFIRFVYASILLFVSTQSRAQTINDDWLLSVFVPCEGLGINGAARAHISIRGNNSAQGYRIDSAILYLSSAAIQAGTVSYTASIAVLEGNSESQKHNLLPPLRNTIEPAAPNETSRVYLPEDIEILAPPGGTIRISVNAIVALQGGSCGLGSGAHDIQLP